jgi:hypothetical protein
MCPRCGSRRVVVMFEPPTVPQAVVGGMHSRGDAGTTEKSPGQNDRPRMDSSGTMPSNSIFNDSVARLNSRHSSESAKRALVDDLQRLQRTAARHRAGMVTRRREDTSF